MDHVPRPATTLQSEILRAGVRRLQELERLPSNWDSYGSPPLVRSSIDAAVRVLGVAAMEHAPVPFIGPTSGGGIEFSWEANDRSLDLALHADGTAEYFAIEKDIEREGEVAATLEASVRSLLRWFLAPAT